MIDTSTCSNFSRTDSLYIPESLFPDGLVISDLVLNEIKDGIIKHKKLNSIIDAVEIRKTISVIDEIEENELEMFSELSDRLSSTDKSCIAIASNRNYFLASDDYRLVMEAKNKSITVLGTVDLLEKAVMRHILSCNDAKKLLLEMKKKARFIAPRHIIC